MAIPPQVQISLPPSLKILPDEQTDHPHPPLRPTAIPPQVKRSLPRTRKTLPNEQKTPRTTRKPPQIHQNWILSSSSCNYSRIISLRRTRSPSSLPGKPLPMAKPSLSLSTTENNTPSMSTDETAAQSNLTTAIPWLPSRIPTPQQATTKSKSPASSRESTSTTLQTEIKF